MNLCKCGRQFKNNGAYNFHLKTCKGILINFDEIRKLYYSGLLISQIVKQYGYTKRIVKQALKGEQKRSYSEIMKIAHQDVNRKKISTFFGESIICNNCGKSFNTGNFKRHQKACNSVITDDEKLNIIKLYNEGQSLKDLSKVYGRSKVRKILKGKHRSLSEAIKLVHKLKPESFKLSNEAKDKIRKKRIEYLKNNPEATAWRQKNLSYPEKLFKQLIEKNELVKKYDIVREYAFFPYFIDFAFINIKLAIEVDGSQHWLKESRIKRDKEKDQLLINKGWKVYHIPEFKLKKEYEITEKQFLEYLNTIDQQPKQFKFENDIIEYEKIKQQKKQQKRVKVNQYFSKIENEFNKRKQDFESIDKSYGYIGKLSKMWNVSHTEVRRYLLNHKLIRRNDYKNIM